MCAQQKKLTKERIQHRIFLITNKVYTNNIKYKLFKQFLSIFHYNKVTMNSIYLRK